MPSWTLSDLISRTTAALGNRTDISLSDASYWVNVAQREVWDALPHNNAEAIATSVTTTNEDKLSLPSDFEELLTASVQTSTNAPVLLDYINYDELAAYSDASGSPLYYSLFDDWLELRPVPDSVYTVTVRYRKQLSDMTVLTDHPSVATRLRMGIMFKAKELMAQNLLLDSEGAALARNEYISYMASKPSDAALRSRSQHALGMSLGRSRGQKAGSSSYSFDLALD